jgi:hypothetical protein
MRKRKPHRYVWNTLQREAIEAVIDNGVQNLLKADPDYFDRKVRQVCVLLHENPTLLEIRDYLIKMIRLETARIELGHSSADFNRLTAALQLKQAVHLKLAAEARERGAH